MSKHTPGPWRVWKGENGEHMVIDANGDAVASLSLRHEDPNCGGAVESANASLIAASTELRGALSGVLLALGMSCGTLAAGDESLVRARAAIKLAEEKMS